MRVISRSSEECRAIAGEVARLGLGLGLRLGLGLG